jgi:hypothetical protein
MMMMR